MTQFADTLVPRQNTWDEIQARFSWPELPWFNMAEACVDRWARQDPDRTALIVAETGKRASFGELAALSNCP